MIVGVKMIEEKNRKERNGNDRSWFWCNVKTISNCKKIFWVL